MVNLLPKEARRRAVLEYRLRLIVVVSLAAAALFAALSALLMPSYFFAMLARTQSATEEQAVNASLSGTQTASAAAEEKGTALLYAAVTAEMKYPRVSQALESIVAAAHPGVALERIEYMDTRKGITLQLSGAAATRDDLLAFKQALSAVPGVSNVTLPLSTLALSQNLPFSVSFSYAPPAASSTSATSTPARAASSTRATATSSSTH